MATVALNPAEASVATDLGVLDVRAVDVRHETAAADFDAEGGHVSVAGVDVAACFGGHARAVDLAVVGFGDVVVDHDEGGAGVGDGGAGVGVLHVFAADAVGGGLEFPPAAAFVDWRGVELARVLCGVELAELVGSGGVDVEVGGEDFLFEVVGDVLEEGFLGSGLDGVDLAERKAEKAVVVLVG